MDSNTSTGPGVKGLCSRFEEKPEQHGQKPVKKPKPVVRKDVLVKDESTENIPPNAPPKPAKKANVFGNQQKIKKEPAVPPKIMKETKAPLIVMYEGKELPQEFTAKDGQLYKLRQMPIVNGPPPEKPPKPQQDADIDDDYGDVAPLDIINPANESGGIRGRQDMTDNFYKNTQDKDDSIYEAYDDVLADQGSLYPGQDPHDPEEIYEDITAITP